MIGSVYIERRILVDTNLDDAQEADRAVLLVDKGQKKTLRLMSNEEIKIFVYPQLRKEIGENFLT